MTPPSSPTDTFTFNNVILLEMSHEVTFDCVKLFKPKNSTFETTLGHVNWLLGTAIREERERLQAAHEQELEIARLQTPHHSDLLLKKAMKEIASLKELCADKDKEYENTFEHFSKEIATLKARLKEMEQ